MSQLSALEKLEKLLVKFWKRFSPRQLQVKAYHCEFAVEPKIFLSDGEVNPEVMALLLEIYLSRVSQDEIKSGRVRVFKDKVEIHDPAGKLLLEVFDPKLIGKLTGKQPPTT